MAEMKEKQAATSASRPPAASKPPSKIDPTAPAGSENSLGAESVRDGRPATDNRTVEAMDEERPRHHRHVRYCCARRQRLICVEFS